jgi:hypothetical protein
MQYLVLDRMNQELIPSKYAYVYSFRLLIERTNRQHTTTASAIKDYRIYCSNFTNFDVIYYRFSLAFIAMYTFSGILTFRSQLDF